MAIKEEINNQETKTGPRWGQILVWVVIIFVLVVAALQLLNESQGGVQVGEEVPDFILTTFEGEDYQLTALRGKVIVVNLWASWCKPCRMENPNLVANYNKYNDKGFEIYQVSLDKDKNKWLEAIKTDNLNWYHVSDLKFWQSYPAQLYKVQSIPASFLIDPEGKIIAKNLRGSQLGAKLAEVLSDSSN